MFANRTRRALVSIVALLAEPSPAHPSGNGLIGTTIAIQILTYDREDRPYYVSKAYHATIHDGPEFGVERESRALYYSAVPVVVDVGTQDIEFSYRTSEFPSVFAEAEFNGYVLSFDACLQFSNVRVVSSDAIAMTDDRVADDGNRIRINVSGLEYTQASRFTVAFDVGSCVMA